MAIAVSLHDQRVRTAQILVAVFLAATVVGAVIFYSRRLRRFLRIDRLLAALPMADTIAKVEQAVFVYRWHKGKVAAAVAYSWLTQGLSVLAVWWLATGLGSQASWHQYFVNMPVIWIAWSLIPVPGGFGVVEFLSQALFSARVLGGAEATMSVDDAATMALAMIVAYRVVQMIVSAPGGILYLARRTGVSPTHMREAMETGPSDA